MNLELAISVVALLGVSTLYILCIPKIKKDTNMNTDKRIYKYDVRTVANYIAYKGEEINLLIDAHQLQKLLYYAECLKLYISYNKESLFKDDFSAFMTGPIIPKLWDRYAKIGFAPIYVLHDYNDSTNPNLVEPEDREILDEIIEYFGTLPASKLSEMTHNEIPWLSTYEEGKQKIIPKDLLYKVFLENENVEALKPNVKSKK